MSFDETDPPIAEHPRPRHATGGIEVSFGTQNNTLLNELLLFRSDFIRQMGWRPATRLNDIDHYDGTDATLHLGIRDLDSEQLFAGLRLTPIAEVQESLSWSMLASNPAMIDSARRHMIDGANTLARLNTVKEIGTGLLWDLTRLVNRLDSQADHARTLAGMLELFGVAHGIIRKRHSPHERLEIRWIFTTTEFLVFALKRVGVNVIVLADGHIRPEDNSKSYFCVVEPESNTDHILDPSNEYHFSARHLESGLAKSQMFSRSTAS
ncbi:hypothetical protein [Mycolicibacter minnesotensis]